VHSKEGHKIEVMRKNPRVCFEVDGIEGMTNWRCVIVHGTFVELKSEAERADGLRILKARLMPYLLSETMRPQGFDNAPLSIEKDRRPVVYRIEISNMTGRFEKNASPDKLLR
jgi:nitroimidazol reductase NimA-like FMN-containing flavoprotein (pyridoxamine 5'-phosphate oxidase superfamily)